MSVKRTTLAGAALALALLAGGDAFAAYCHDGKATTWDIVIAPHDEPGERMILEGRVIDTDGKGIPGVTVYVYHTDNDGVYSETNDNRDPRLCGLILTDEKGRYRIDTIRPAGYPDARVPAHVHFRIYGGKLDDEHRLDLFFQGDDRLSARAIERDKERSGGADWGNIRPITRRDDPQD